MIALKKRQPRQPNQIYQLKISLRHSKPSIWRRIQVVDNIKLKRLHDVFQVVMGWYDCHLHKFSTDEAVYVIPAEDDFNDPDDFDERRYTLADIAPCEKVKFQYEYDFGDSWEHDVVVEAFLPLMERNQVVCIDGKNACPPEDCGGVPGYYEFLEAIGNPQHEEHEQMLEWIGGAFDPKQFNIEKVNSRLKRLKV